METVTDWYDIRATYSSDSDGTIFQPIRERQKASSHFPALMVAYVIPWIVIGSLHLLCSGDWF